MFHYIINNIYLQLSIMYTIINMAEEKDGFVLVYDSESDSDWEHVTPHVTPLVPPLVPPLVYQSVLPLVTPLVPPLVPPPLPQPVPLSVPNSLETSYVEIEVLSKPKFTSESSVLLVMIVLWISIFIWPSILYWIYVNVLIRGVALLVAFVLTKQLVTTSPSEYQEIPQRFFEKCKVYISEAVTRAASEIVKENVIATTNLFYAFFKKV